MAFVDATAQIRIKGSPLRNTKLVKTQKGLERRRIEIQVHYDICKESRHIYNQELKRTVLFL